MSDHSVLSGLLRRSPSFVAKPRRGPAEASRLSSSRRPVWTALGSTGCCSSKATCAVKGPLIGVELVKDLATKEQFDAAQLTALIDFCRDQGVIVGRSSGGRGTPDDRDLPADGD